MNPLPLDNAPVSHAPSSEPSEQAEFPWPSFPLGFGTGRLCSLNGGLSITKATALLQQAFDLGIRFVDTAPSYGQGQAEIAIGRLNSSVREELLICTKIGYSLGSKGDLINVAKPWLRPILPWVGALRGYIQSTRHRTGTNGGMTVAIEPTAIRTALEDSLGRLKREHVDIFMMHDPSLSSVQDEQNQAEMDRLIRSGKIRRWGISTNLGEVADIAADIDGCSVIEIPGYPGWADDHVELFKKCEATQVDLIVNGVLTPVTGQPHGDHCVGESMTPKACFQYASSLPATKMILAGARKLENLNSNIEIMRELNAE